LAQRDGPRQNTASCRKASPRRPLPPLPFVYGLVRLTPGAVRQSVELDDSLSPAPFVAQSWAFSLDASAGAAFLLGPQEENSASPVRWWLAAEGGYSYTGSTSLLMHPDLAEGDPRPPIACILVQGLSELRDRLIVPAREAERSAQ
jgi:hypothetical protein